MPIAVHCGKLDPTIQDGPLAGRQIMRHSVAVLLPKLRRDQKIRHLTAARLVSRVAEYPLRSRIEIQDPPHPINGDHRVQRRSQNGAFQYFRLAKLCPNFQLIGDIHMKPHAASVLVTDRQRNEIAQ